jgi:hypothetical protein
MFDRITETRREHDQVGLDSLADLQIRLPAFVTTHRRHALYQSFANSADHSAPVIGSVTCPRATQTNRRNVLGQPREVVDIDPKNPMWNRMSFDRSDNHARSSSRLTRNQFSSTSAADAPPPTTSSVRDPADLPHA